MAALAAMFVFWFAPILRLSGGWWFSHSYQFDALRALGVVEAWRCGLWDARWFPDFDYGYGYPILSYYAPLFHWMSGAWLLIVPSPSVAVRLNLFCWFLFGTAGIYLAGERLWSLITHGQASAFRPGMMCAMGWLMSPYLMSNVFVRAALPEFASIQIVPWVVWAAVGILGRSGAWTPRDSVELLLSALFIALGILLHNFCGLCIPAIAALAVPVAFIARRFGSPESSRARPRVSARIAGWTVALGWALAATIFYWLPALHERSFTRVNSAASGLYYYASHFLYLRNFLRVFYWDYGRSIDGPDDDLPLHLGLVGFVALAGTLATLAILALSRTRRNARLAVGIALLAWMTALGILLTTESSAILWRSVPLLQYAQFPWRLLSIPTVGICLLLPAALVAAAPRRRGLATAFALLVLILCYGLSHHLYCRIKGKRPYCGIFEVRNWSDLEIRTTALDEYGPIWRKSDRPPRWPRGLPLPNDSLEVKRFDSQRVAMTASIVNQSDRPQPLVVAVNYFPGWQGRIEPGKAPLALSPDPATGFIRIENIPPGPSAIRVWFGNTPIRRNCKIASGIAWLAWIGAGALLAATSSIFSCNRRKAHL